MKPRTFVLALSIMLIASTGIISAAGEETLSQGPVVPDAVQKLLSESTVKPKVRLYDSGTRVRELIGRFPLNKSDRLDGTLLDFVERHREAFGLKDPRAELIAIRTGKRDGNDLVVFQQTSGGYPIWGATLEMEVDSGELVLAVNRTLNIVQEALKPDVRRRDAIESAGREWERQRGALLPPCASELIIYKRKLVYDVKVPDSGAVFHIMVDATEGKIAGIEKVVRDRSGTCH